MDELSVRILVVANDGPSWQLGYLQHSAASFDLCVSLTSPKGMTKALAEMHPDHLVLRVLTDDPVVVSGTAAQIVATWRELGCPELLRCAGLFFGTVRASIACGVPMEDSAGVLLRRVGGEIGGGLLASKALVTQFLKDDLADPYFRALFPTLRAPTDTALATVPELDAVIVGLAATSSVGVLETLATKIATINPAWTRGMCAVLKQARMANVLSPSLVSAALRVIANLETHEHRTDEEEATLFALHDEVALALHFQKDNAGAMEHQVAAFRLVQFAPAQAERMARNMKFFMDGHRERLLPRPSPNTHVVIAHFSEDIGPVVTECARLFAGAHVFVYTKGGCGTLFAHTLSRPGISVSLHTLPNVGRETHTYLHHLVSHYGGGLPEKLVFLPGSVLMDPGKRKLLEIVATKPAPCFPATFEVPAPAAREWEVLAWPDRGFNGKQYPISPARFRPFNTWMQHVVGFELPNLPTYVWSVCPDGIFSARREEVLRHPLPYLCKLLAEVSGHPNPEAGHFVGRLWVHLFCQTNHTVKFVVTPTGIQFERHVGFPHRIDNVTGMVREAWAEIIREGSLPPKGWRSVFQVFAGDVFAVTHRPFGPVNRAYSTGCPPNYTEEYGAPCFAFSGWYTMDPRPYDAIVEEIREAGEAVPIHDRVFWSGSVACVQTRKRCKEIIDTAAPPGWFYFNDTDRGEGETDLHAVASTRSNGFVPMADQVRENAALLDINGNGYPARRKFFVHSGRPLIIPDADLVDWPAHELQPWVHYIPAGHLGEGIIDAARWVREHPDEAAAIASRAKEWAHTRCTHAAAVKRFQHIIMSSLDPLE